MTDTILVYIVVFAAGVILSDTVKNFVKKLFS